MPEPKVTPYSFPKHAYIEEPDRPYRPLGRVQARADFTSLDPGHEEKMLCRNYFNKAVRDLVKQAQKQGADAVVGVRSIVFLMDGRVEAFARPECSDDGEEGQALAQGVAVKWADGPGEKPAPVPKGWLVPLRDSEAKGPEFAPKPR